MTTASVLLAHPAAALLADNDTDKGSPIGLFVVLVLIIAVYFLDRSMNKHMRNLPESFDPPDATGPAAAPPDRSLPESQPGAVGPDRTPPELAKPD